MNNQLTNSIITQMLTESTGKHYMDSGDTYGRHWEENKKNGIKTGGQPVDFYFYGNNCELTGIIPIYDFLINTVEYDEECQMLESLLPNLNADTLYYIEDVINNPVNYDSNMHIFDYSSSFGTYVDNTYNYENLLSQDYQYLHFEYNGEDYIAISIHNGCDIRGGYTDLHIFYVEYPENMYVASSQAHIQCKCGCHNYHQEIYELDENDIDEVYVYNNVYQDDDNHLRCKKCGELILSTVISI